MPRRYAVGGAMSDSDNGGGRLPLGSVRYAETGIPRSQRPSFQNNTGTPSASGGLDQRRVEGNTRATAVPQQRLASGDVVRVEDECHKERRDTRTPTLWRVRRHTAIDPQIRLVHVRVRRRDVKLSSAGPQCHPVRRHPPIGPSCARRAGRRSGSPERRRARPRS